MRYFDLQRICAGAYCLLAIWPLETYVRKKRDWTSIKRHTNWHISIL